SAPPPDIAELIVPKPLRVPESEIVVALTVPPAIVNDPPLETVIVSVAPVPVPFTFRIFVVTATVAPLPMLSESTAFVFTFTVSVYAPFEPAAFRTMSSPAAGTPLGDQAPAVPQFPFFGLVGPPPPLPWQFFVVS